ncbi:uncharacterized protein LOC135157058 [Lytechinus pictus]|uniref:uncharacterized protein LOC135157058 n=1 Tax=Lytechinus pictus TaxID=7653 RepID=UPI0030BA08F3
MASFSSTEVRCEDPKCPSNGTSEDVASYGIRKPMNLCPDCAERKNHEGVILPRGEQRGTTFCTHHRDRVASWFCTSHDATVCQECKSSTDHQGCTLKGVEDVLKEAASRLKESLKQVRHKHGELRNQEAKLQRTISKLDTHFKTIKEAIKSTKKGKGRKKDERRRHDDGQNRRTRSVGAGAEDIQNENEAEQCLKQIDEGQRRADRLVKTVKEQLNKCLEDTLTIAERIEQLLRDSDRGMDDIKSILGDVEATLRLSVDIHLMDIAEHFIHGIRYERKNDIDLVKGYRRSMWYMSDSITLPQKIRNPQVRCIDSKEVAVLDIHCKAAYRVTLRDKKVKQLDIDLPIADLVSHNGKIVCLDDGGLSLRVYSRQWQYIQDISLPGHIFEKLAVGCSKNLLALARERRAFIIKPTEMTIHQRHSIEINIDGVKEFVALTSGHIIVKQQGKTTFTVLDPKGTQIRKINQINGTEASVCVDKTTGTAYVLYLDKTSKDFAVCRFSVAGGVVQEEVYDLHKLDPRLKFHLDVLESKKLYICNGNKLFFFTIMSADDPYSQGP